MCGFVGRIGKGRLGWLDHRGKERSTFKDGDLQINFNRLSIINPTASQPVTVGDYTVFLNGCIYNYKGDSDTKWVAEQISKEGLGAIKTFNGMFALVIGRKSTRELYLARDRYGIKPIYYLDTDDGFYFASEIKGLPYKKGVNEQVLSQWLVLHQNLTNETLFKGVMQVPPATIHRRKEAWSEQTYWKWDLKEVYYDYNESVEHLRNLLTTAVERQLVGDHPVACELSGGVDSSALARLSKGECYTVDFEQDSELKYAQKIAETTPIKIEKKHISYLNPTIRHLEDLRAGASWSNYALYKRMMDDGVVVALSGTGSDELFMGYTWRYEGNYFDKVNRTKIGGKHEDYCRWFIKEDLEYRRLYDLKHFMGGLLTVGDKLSMSATIESRVPFLDNDVVDFVTQLPVHYLWGKRILKDALKGIVPQEILNRQKQGFTSPDYFDGFKYKRIKDYLTKDMIDLGKGNTPLTWSLVAFETWLEEFQ